jgi:hypothetical protein
MDKDDVIYLLELMKGYDYGHDARQEIDALDYAIQAIKDRRELHKDIYNG